MTRRRPVRFARSDDLGAPDGQPWLGEPVGRGERDAGAGGVGEQRGLPHDAVAAVLGPRDPVTHPEAGEQLPQRQPEQERLAVRPVRSAGRDRVVQGGRPVLAGDADCAVAGSSVRPCRAPYISSTSPSTRTVSTWAGMVLTSSAKCPASVVGIRRAPSTRCSGGLVARPGPCPRASAGG